MMPRWLSNPGTFGYGPSVFAPPDACRPAQPEPRRGQGRWSRRRARQGKTITIGTSSQLANIAAVTGATRRQARRSG